MNKYLIPKKEFEALLESANHAPKQEAYKSVWFTIKERVVRNRKSFLDYSFLDDLTAGQYALVCSAWLHQGIEASDFITYISLGRHEANRAFKAFEILRADEYLRLLREVEGIFPSKKFTDSGDEIFSAVCKQPDDYFKKMGKKILTGNGMKRPLHDYVFEYIITHPEEFCDEPFDSPLKIKKSVGDTPARPAKKSNPKSQQETSQRPSSSSRHGRGKRHSPDDGQFALIRSAHTGGPNYGLDTEAIIAHLSKWRSLCIFTVIGAEHDTVDIKFKTLPQDMDAFVRDLYEFCPDLVDQGTGIADELVGPMIEAGKTLTPEWSRLTDGVDFSNENFGLEILKRLLQQNKAVTLWWD
jgi:hypothetical protein